MATIVLIDDDDQLRRLCHSALQDAGYRVLSAASGKEGVRLLHDQVVDVILVDIFMPDIEGLELIPLFRKTRPATKIIAISGGSGTGNYLDAAKHLGATAPPQETVQFPRVAAGGRIAVEVLAPVDPAATA